MRDGKIKADKLGGMDGGGGKVIICPTPGGTKATTLDLYEGAAAGLTMDAGPGTTLDEKLKYVLNRLSKVAPYHANAYAIWINDFLNKKEASFFDNAILPVTEDTGLVVYPRGL